MKKAILATKVGMTQIFNEAGVLVPVTVLQAGPCVVTQIKTEENDGYNSVQVAYGQIRTKLVNKAKAGHLAKAGVEKKTVKKGEGQREVYEAGRFIREFKLDNAADYSVKDEIKADIFAAGDMVDASAISKGKGFQGANGSSSDPSHVFKGKKMPGHMGAKKVTTQNLEVVRVDLENGIILVKGAVPGAKKALVTLKETVKVSK